MIGWEETETGLRAFNDAKAEIPIRALDWTHSGSAREIPHPVDTTVSGSASELRFPPAFTDVRSTTDDRHYELGSEIGPIRLPEGDYVVQVNHDIKTYVRFTGAATVRKTADYDSLIVSFPRRTPLTLGFRSRLRYPNETVTVPPTPEGLSRALSHLHCAHETTSPDRSYHAQRAHPPLLELGDSYDIPTSVVDRTADTGIELILPAELPALFVTAPLAYYLQATVTVEEGAEPLLRAPGIGFAHELSPVPDLQHDAAELLHRTFLLDCLVRNAGPKATNLAETRLLDPLGIDAEATYRASPAERLRTYLDADFGLVRPELPEWHLSMYVAPTTEHVSTLPFLLDTLSHVYLPETSELTGKELMQRSLNDFYRGRPPTVPSRNRSRQSGGSVASIDVVKPRLQRGRVHGWLADGVPIDVFKTLPVAYENRLDYVDRTSDDITVTVVLNDREMGDEHSSVADIYAERSEDLPLEVTVRKHLSREELADVFETPTDFVHYIGHCEESGLRCTDGNLSMADIGESNAQTFFLNACGSYYEGLELVRQGSVAGGVTFKRVLNEQAAKVGTAFARLLVNGFSIERALRLARRRIMMGKDYAVVGNGTHVLTQCDNYIPLTAKLERADGDRFHLTCDVFSAHVNGGYYQPYIPDNEHSYLYGTNSEFTLDRCGLRSYLNRAKMPVIFEGNFYWSEELADELG